MGGPQPRDVLGGIGAARELGSVLGPLYGIAVVWLLNSWRYVFWINVPLAAIAMVMMHFSLLSRQKDLDTEKVDVVGGVLLAIALGPAAIGLYNPEPDGKQVLPSWGLPALAKALVATVAFFVGALRPEPADRARRRALPAVPGRAGRIAGRRSGADGDPGQRRTVRSGRAGHGSEPGRGAAAALRSRRRSARCWADGSPPRLAIASSRSSGC